MCRPPFMHIRCADCSVPMLVYVCVLMPIPNMCVCIAIKGLCSADTED